MTTTEDIARAHGHHGPAVCQDCGTTDSVHVGSWWDPATEEGGTFLQCCSCGIATGDPIYVHAIETCRAPAALYVPNVNSDPYGKLAHQRIHERAIEAYLAGQHEAARCEYEGRAADEHALANVLEAVGRAYAAAALTRAAETLREKLDEETYLALTGVAATLDLDVVEDLDGANGTGQDSPEVRVFRQADGWTMNPAAGAEACTTNFQRQRDGQPACTDTAVWKVVEDYGLHLSIGFYCDADLPAEHRPAA